MTTLNKSQTLALIRQFTGPWTCRTERIGTGYSRQETYSANGKPVFAMTITFNPPRCVAVKL